MSSPQNHIDVTILNFIQNSNMYPQPFTERWGILFIIISCENAHFTILQHRLIKHYYDMPHLIDHRALHHPLCLEFRDLVFL